MMAANQANAEVENVIEKLPPELRAPNTRISERIVGQITLAIGFESTLREISDPEKATDHTRLKREEINSLVDAGLLEPDFGQVNFGRCGDYSLTGRARLLLSILDE